MSLVVASVIFSVLALLSLIVIGKRTLQITIEVAGRRSEVDTPAGARSDAPAAPRLVAGTLRKSSAAPHA